MNPVLLAALTVLLTAVTLSQSPPDALAAQGTPTATVTFHKDVLPILQKNCQTCHRPGQIAPMSFLSYESTRPWARAMRNAVLSKRMPPWFADPAYGHFSNNRSLAAGEIETIVTWVDAGAPAGDLKDAPSPVQWAADGWQITPDLIVEGPTYEVPPTGVVEWTWIVVPGNFKEDTWVTSVELKPSQLAVTHHVCLVYFPHDPSIPYFTPMARAVPRDGEGVEVGRGTAQQAQLPSNATTFVARGNGIEECYEPGRMPADFRPYGAAKLIPAGTDIAVNVHYTPNGKTLTDHVQIGFTLAKERPKRRYLALSTSAPQDRTNFAIPPGDPNWQAPPAVVTFTRDVELVGLMPHMHVRGKAARFFLDYPDGRSETILNVPGYDFNWQLWYDTSINVSKGTMMRVLAWYDNSPRNRFNPNPKATVYYGDQTWEEMHFPSYGVVVDDITLTQRDVVGRGGLVGGQGTPAQPAN